MSMRSSKKSCCCAMKPSPEPVSQLGDCTPVMGAAEKGHSWGRVMAVGRAMADDGVMQLRRSWDPGGLGAGIAKVLGSRRFWRLGTAGISACSTNALVDALPEKPGTAAEHRNRRDSGTFAEIDPKPPGSQGLRPPAASPSEPHDHPAHQLPSLASSHEKMPSFRIGMPGIHPSWLWDALLCPRSFR